MRIIIVRDQQGFNFYLQIGKGDSLVLPYPATMIWSVYERNGVEDGICSAQESTLWARCCHEVAGYGERRDRVPGGRCSQGKFGAVVATSLCASLQGPEVFLLDLAGLRKYANLGGEGSLPADPLVVGKDLTQASYIMIALIGELKGELGTRHHLMALASTTMTGVELRWWLEQLVRVQEEEGCTMGPAGM